AQFRSRWPSSFRSCCLGLGAQAGLAPAGAALAVFCQAAAFSASRAVSIARNAGFSILMMQEGTAMLHLLLTAAILVQPIQLPGSDQDQPPAPIQVSRKEADQHAIGDGDRFFYLRVPQNQWSDFSSIRVRVVVDATGTVISTHAQVASPDGNHRILRSTIEQA